MSLERTLLNQIKELEELIEKIKTKQVDNPDNKLIKVILNQDETLLKSLKFDLEKHRKEIKEFKYSMPCYERNKIRISGGLYDES